MDGDQGRNAGAFGEDFADAMAGGFGGDHGDVHAFGSFDGFEVDAEAVGEHQRLAGGEVRGNFTLVERSLDVIRYQDHHDVGGFGGFGGIEHREAGGFGFGAAFAGGGEADNY